MDKQISHPLRNVLVVILLLILGGCAAAPVQEMSDARQAIQAAKSVGVDENTQSNLVKAQQYLHKAEQALEVGEYSEARHNAIAARQQAMEAQQFANLRTDY